LYSSQKNRKPRQPAFTDVPTTEKKKARKSVFFSWTPPNRKRKTR
jgi:hypothetical protein